MSKKSKNFSKSTRQQKFLGAIPTEYLSQCDILERSKFNFSYFVNDEPGKDFPGQDFIDWNTTKGNSKLVKLINKLKDFSRFHLEHWQKEKTGPSKRHSCLEVYKDFPANSDFTHPKHVPADVWWARFRIDNDPRLIGFIIPDNLEKEIANDFDFNTFYVVFLDEHHCFYKLK